MNILIYICLTKNNDLYAIVKFFCGLLLRRIYLKKIFFILFMYKFLSTEIFIVICFILACKFDFRRTVQFFHQFDTLLPSLRILAGILLFSSPTIWSHDQ